MCFNADKHICLQLVDAMWLFEPLLDVPFSTPEEQTLKSSTFSTLTAKASQLQLILKKKYLFI
jgi:hypothetical protein